ncbi:thiamine pyrophosphate-dependent enzyme [Syntrophotalea acetylenica]|jgi:indolepyruvate ferredoxin oxidoreductase alpha subunit|uniref:Indolepyruvate oxidoreductase subunit IorA n=1 Tax=Syntrophotalea acetylenica TaxID=29542 RepID=A0A1L3GHN6_SYNAC|nr:thiamine pyrophosphate-dependent enzyme [Syntrophotalea acetylenica]APG25441.1 indolepyruvate oxidoreductase [Syntrophotalea acetylenica]APG43509.1 indolepyruvate oxidoreductase [Syntrophotalea acetylenica]MDY0263081.1 thiamine pyrophosphate-dependent enzyme [Syntrophotalea acetylenica]
MTESSKQTLLMGNEAIARGLVEAGCAVAAAYPGTPSTETMTALVRLQPQLGAALHVEWSLNEKIAFEVALAASYTGKRAAAIMKQVGLNVAADPFMRAAYLGVVGGLLLVVADDPGPHSSQNEQDSRFFAHFARVPVLDPSSPAEARDMVALGYALSERYRLPVMLRPTTRICHARQNVGQAEPLALGRRADFVRDPSRWAATPAFLPALHQQLNDKIDRIARDPQVAPRLLAGDGSFAGRCVVASGIAFANACDLLADMQLLGKVDVYQVLLPYPLHRPFIDALRDRYDTVLILEETYPVIQQQLAHPGAVGRGSRLLPAHGELLPDAMLPALEDFFGLQPSSAGDAAPAGRDKRPALCAGCGHRAAFHVIKKVFPGGIFPSDIGCYTLGLNLGAVDTVHCMGACISQAAGFYQAYAQDGGEVPAIVATIGDSTFFHAGIPALINTVIQQARIIVVVLDNATTAMTGHQPSPHLGLRADGRATPRVLIEDLVRACGVRFLEVCDPYDTDMLAGQLKQADAFCRGEDGGPAVIIARHPCLMDKQARHDQPRFCMSVGDDCNGCRYCLQAFECPALFFDEACGRVDIDQDLCVGCGVCQKVCPRQAIRKEEPCA